MKSISKLIVILLLIFAVASPCSALTIAGIPFDDNVFPDTNLSEIFINPANNRQANMIALAAA